MEIGRGMGGDVEIVFSNNNHLKLIIVFFKCSQFKFVSSSSSFFLLPSPKTVLSFFPSFFFFLVLVYDKYRIETLVPISTAFWSQPSFEFLGSSARSFLLSIDNCSCCCYPSIEILTVVIRIDIHDLSFLAVFLFPNSYCPPSRSKEILPFSRYEKNKLKIPFKTNQLLLSRRISR